MKPSWCEEFATAFDQRSDFYRLLSSIFYKEVSEEFIERLAGLDLAGQDGGAEFDAAARDLARYVARRGPDARTDLAVDYAHLFLAAGVYEGDAACPYESIYTSERRLMMQEARDEVVKVYRANGVDVNGSLNVPEDHLSFELEFMAIMSDRAAQIARRENVLPSDLAELAVNLGVQREFARTHLLNWLPMLAGQIKKLADQEFYPAIIRLSIAYVREDELLLDEMLGVVEEQR